MLSHEFFSALSKLHGSSIRLGRQQCLEAFREAYLEDLNEELENDDPTASTKFKDAIKVYEETQFPCVNKVSSNIDCSAKDIMKIEPSQGI